MRSALKPHPDTPSRAVTAIEVEAVRLAPGRLDLRFVVTGRLADVLWPRPAEGRADELWKHTCFEAFVQPVGGDPYWEFNLSPSTQWAAYAFDGYRSGMRALDEIGQPSMGLEYGPDRFVMSAQLQIVMAPPAEPSWRLGLSAVIEETSGAKSYWALRHPLGAPDFHHADCFVLELP
jgi:hypothetical protein